MNIVFFGNTKYSVIVAQALFETFGLSAVVTTTDKLVGREKTLTPTPVSLFSQKNHIPAIQTDTLTQEIIDQVKAYTPDFLVVADYGLFLPTALLKVPTYASLNVHHSLLPKYPGPTPAPSAILHGDALSGVSVIIMSEKIDAGDILGQEPYTLKPDETTQSLLTALNTLGGKLVVSVINNVVSQNIQPIKQDQSKAVYTPHLTKESGYIDLAHPPSPEIVDRMIRAYYPWPGVWTTAQIKNRQARIKFLPGKKIQLEGKNPVSIKDFLNGYPEVASTITKLYSL